MERCIAVVGCGYWGRNLVRNFAELGALGRVVDYSPDVAAAQAKQHGAIASTLEEALADPAIRGVVIAAPAELHADIALQSFAAGKHVYVEKPMAMTVAEGERMAQGAKAAKRQLMVGHLLRYHPGFEKLLELVQAGELGDVAYAYSNRLSLGKFRTEENVLWSFAPHDVSMLLALMGGEPVSVSGGGGAFLTPGIEDEYRLDMTFANGARAHVFCSWMHPFKEHRLIVVGRKAMAAFEDSAPAGQKLRLYRHKIEAAPGAVPNATKSDAEIVAFADDEPLKRECAHFLDCALHDRQPRTDEQEGLRVLSVLTRVGAAEAPKPRLAINRS